MEITGSVASLGKRPILLGGDWTFEPDDFPIDLVHGATVHRPLGDEAATSPVTHGEDAPDNGTKIGWFLVSKPLAWKKLWATACSACLWSWRTFRKGFVVSLTMKRQLRRMASPLPTVTSKRTASYCHQPQATPG
eukprot:5699969-Amphidinium_carterae.3